MEAARHQDRQGRPVVVRGGKRQCTKCLLWKSLDEFRPLNNPRSAIRVRPTCYECDRAYSREVWRRRKDDPIRGAKKAEQDRDYWLRVAYGITAQQYDAMFLDQNGGCAICGEPPRKRRLDVDHDRDTGKVRGLLCNAHNQGIGQFRHNPKLLMSAVQYLMKHVKEV